MFTCENCHQDYEDKELVINYKYQCCRSCLELELQEMKETSKKVAPGFVLGVLNKAKSLYYRVRG